MSVTVTWANTENTVLLFSLFEVWTWDEARSAGLQVLAMLDRAPHKLSLIVDLSKTTFMPPSGFVENTKWAAQTYHQHPMLERIIVAVERSRLEPVKTIMTTYRAAGKEYSYVNSVEAAMKFVESYSAK